MQQTDGVAVLATQLAHTDRRALSQAWYSALHIARDPSRPRPPRASEAVATDPGACFVRRPATSDAPNVAPNPTQRTCPSGGAERAAEADAAERRSAKSALARRIERGVRAQGRRPGMASFAVRDERARVHVTVRTSGAQTRIVAVCEPALRERVERALAQARFALVARGVRVEAVR